MSRRRKSDDENRFNERVGGMIWELRKVKSMRAKDLARAVGVSPVQLCNYESGATPIPLFRLDRLSLILGVSLADLMQISSCGEFPRKRCAQCLNSH
jgi:transcriptional regulator with XRE-family HTH domain